MDLTSIHAFYILTLSLKFCKSPAWPRLEPCNVETCGIGDGNLGVWRVLNVESLFAFSILTELFWNELFADLDKMQLIGYRSLFRVQARVLWCFIGTWLIHHWHIKKLSLLFVGSKIGWFGCLAFGLYRLNEADVIALQVRVSHTYVAANTEASTCTCRSEVFTSLWMVMSHGIHPLNFIVG